MFLLTFKLIFKKISFPPLFWFSCFLSFTNLYHFGNFTSLLRDLVSFFVGPNKNCSVG